MRKLTLLLILVFAPSACFKDAGSDTPTAQPISLVSNSGSVVQPSLETPQVSPTIEMVITEEATEAAATPTEEATEVVFVATATATEFVPPSLTPTQVIISTATATATVTQASVFIPVGPQPTLTMIGSGQGGAGEETEAIPLGEPTQEMFNATQIAMAQATSTPTLTNTPIPTNTLLPTATQTPQPTNTAISTTAPAGSQFGQPTLTTIPLIAVQPSTATPDFGTGGALATVEVAQLPTQQGLTVNQMTATAVIQNATATANAIFAIQTQQAGGAVVASPQVVTPGATIQVQPTIATTDCAYLVPLGETLSEIARRYNLTIDQIANYNSITNPNLIRAGYEIIIPGCGQIAPTATPFLTPIPSGQGGQVTTPTDNSFGPFTYTVVAGDNIYRISVRYGITMRELLNANPQITNMNVISEGQQITVPGPPTQLTTAPQSTIVVQPTQAVVPQQIFTPTFTPFGN